MPSSGAPADASERPGERGAQAARLAGLGQLDALPELTPARQ